MESSKHKDENAPRGERQSARIAAAFAIGESKPVYDMRKHPQDQNFRKLGLGNYGPRKKSGRKNKVKHRDIIVDSKAKEVITIWSSDVQDGSDSVTNSSNQLRSDVDLDDNELEIQNSPVHKRQRVMIHINCRSSPIVQPASSTGFDSNVLGPGRKPNFVTPPTKSSHRPRHHVWNPSFKLPKGYNIDKFAPGAVQAKVVPSSSNPSVGQPKPHLGFYDSESCQSQLSDKQDSLSGLTPTGTTNGPANHQSSVNEVEMTKPAKDELEVDEVVCAEVINLDQT